METWQNKALKGKMRGEEDGTFVKRVSTPKDVVSTFNMTKIPDHSLGDQLDLKSGNKKSTLK